MDSFTAVYTNVGQMVRKTRRISCRRSDRSRYASGVQSADYRSGVEAQNLRSLAKSFGLAENVTLQTERVPNSVLAQVYDKAFITAMPSEYEIFGMTILESFACGTPVIGWCGGGMSDLIEDGITGYLYEDVDDISRRIIRLYEDREVYLSLRKTAQEASAKYDWKAVAPRFLAVYSSCLSAGKRGQV